MLFNNEIILFLVITILQETKTSILLTYLIIKLSTLSLLRILTLDIV